MDDDETTWARRERKGVERETSEMITQGVTARPPPKWCPNTSINSRFRRVGILGGKTLGRKDCYQASAIDLGTVLVSKGLNVICREGSTGLLEVLSQAVQAAGGHVFNSPSMKSDQEDVILHLHQQKEEFSQLSDCFIILPGDLGAMEEFMELVSWAQLGIHDKPIGLLNVDGFFDSFLSQIDTAIEEGFTKPSQKQIIITSTNARDLLRKMEEYKPMHEGALPKHLWKVEEGSSKN